MKLTKIQIFKNTPFTDFQNTIHFKDNNERDLFFDNHYQKYEFSTQFNFVRDRLVLRANVPTIETYGMNYLRFQNDFEGGRWYYCFIMSTTYLNDGNTEFGLVLDTVMTFTQGDFSQHVNNVEVMRQSLNSESFKRYHDFLMTNQDTLVLPKRYTHQMLQYWDKLYVVFTSSVDLRSDFGSEKNPELTTAKGQTYDKIVSPIDLYVCESQDQFTKLMKALSDYPWISQNIHNVAIVPQAMIDINDLEDLGKVNNDEVTKVALKVFKNGAKTATSILSDLSLNKADLPERFKFGATIPEYCMREQYASITMTAWNGQTVSYDPTFIPDDGVQIIGQSTFGYHNEIRVFMDKYQDNNENSITGLWRGAYTGKGLIFDNFDDIPVLVDNYKLSAAQTAHQRELGNQRTISGRINSVISPNSSIDDRFFNAVSLTTSLAGGVARNALGQFTNEYEHYRDQRAELADKAISAPSVADQNNSQAFNIAHNIYGVTLKFESVADNIARVRAYHQTFGFDFQGQVLPVESVESLPIMNYLSFQGNWTLPDVPSQFVQQLKITFENGVKMWHNNGTDNPFNQNLLNNWR